MNAKVRSLILVLMASGIKGHHRSENKAFIRWSYAAMAILFLAATALTSLVGLQHRKCRNLNPELVRLHMALDDFEHACVSLIYGSFTDENTYRYRSALTTLGGRVTGNEWPESFVVMHQDIVLRMERLWPEIEDLAAGESFSEGLVLINEYYGEVSDTEKHYEAVGELIDFTINDYFDYSDALYEIRDGQLKRQQTTSKLRSLGILVAFAAIVLFLSAAGNAASFPGAVKNEGNGNSRR